MWVRAECCVDPLRPPRLPETGYRLRRPRFGFLHPLLHSSLPYPRGVPMNCIVRKPLFVSSALIVTLGAALLASSAQNPPQATAPQNAAPAAAKTAAQQFKNIQVLKDVPADQLIPAMQFVTASLGVDCEYCHVEHAFDKDDKKPKVMTRKMMEMMITINTENFESHRMVTCYTCHQGGAHPVSIPAISEHQIKPEMMEGSVT